MNDMNSSRSPVAAGNGDGLAEALHLQRLYKSLRLNSVLDYVENVISQPISDLDTDSDDEQLVGYNKQPKSWNGDSNVYNWSSVQKKRRWVCDALLHSSDSEDSELSLTCASSLARAFVPEQRRRQSRGKTQPEVTSDEDGEDEDLESVGDEARLDNELGMASVKKEFRTGEEKEQSAEFEEQSIIGNRDQRRQNCSGPDEHDAKRLKVEGPSDVFDNIGAKNSSRGANFAVNNQIGSSERENDQNASSETKWKDETVPPSLGESEIKQEVEDEELKQKLALNDEDDSGGGDTDDEATDDSDERSEEDDADEDSDEREETDESDANEKQSSSAANASSHGALQNHHGAATALSAAGLASVTPSARQNNQRRIDALIREHLLRKGHACDYQALDDGVVSESGESSSRARSFLYYGAGLVSNVDRYSDHQRYMACSRRARGNFSRSRGGVGGSGGAGAAYGTGIGALTSGGGGGGSLTIREDRRGRPAHVTPSLSSSQITIKEEDLDDSGLMDQNTDSLLSMAGDDGDEGMPDSGGDPSKLRARASARREKKGKKLDAQALAVRRHKLWLVMARKEVVRQQRTRAAAHKEMLHNCKRVAVAAMKFCRQKALQSQKVVKDKQWLLKRLCRSMQTEWKKFDRIVKEQNKRAEREAEEQRKMDKEIMEAKRQQRKVNFLITLPELYAHFMQNKMTGEVGTVDDTSADILRQLDDAQPPGGAAVSAADEYDCEVLKAQALQTAQEAVRCQQARLNKFGSNAPPAASSEGPARAKEWPQPDIFMGQLKSYQMKGMNWIANLYYFGINGILADEMGLGKTVQAIAFLAHICEEYDTWGPFLIVTPASTLHNWTEEINRFVPEFKVVPYWGTPEERKLLRKFFDTKESSERRDVNFHVVVTSYHIVIQDFKFLNRLKWNYMVLDEAQAIKSIQSQRWKLLLGFSCRNRLLLSGTPIQNTMAELWALLHFIMPALFDSHQWFNEWFSKDIEGHVENRTHVDEKHLNRLHTILKPFMLRRIKTEVENELTDKIEIMVYCPLTLRQKFLYSGLKNKISIEELLHSSSGSSAAQSSVTTSLMNLVMQFRKVCNHPELLERREVQSPLFVTPESTLLPRLVYHLGMEPRHHHLTSRLSPSSAHHIHGQLHTDLSASCVARRSTRSQDPWLGSWWFASLCGLSVQEVSHLMRGDDLSVFWQLWHRQYLHRDRLARHRRFWHRRHSKAEAPILIDYKNRVGDLPEDGIQMAGWAKLPSSSPLAVKAQTSSSHQSVGRDSIETSTSASEDYVPINPLLDDLLLSGRDHHSGVLQSLMFCSHTSNFYTFTDHIIHRMPETVPHRHMRENKLRRPLIEEVPATGNSASSPCGPDTLPIASGPPASSPSAGDNNNTCVASDLTAAPGTPSTTRQAQGLLTTSQDAAALPLSSPIKEELPESVPMEGDCSGLGDDGSGSPMPPAPPLLQLYRPPTTRHHQPTFTPGFITHTCPKVVCSVRRPYCFDPHASDCGIKARRDPLLEMLQRGVDDTLRQNSTPRALSCPLQAEDRGGLNAIPPVTAGWNNVLIPDKHSLMMDAGKLFVLDSLLRRMKAAGNRVLIYSQMTKMINLLEEYMRHRQHKYMRLDGSSKISDRRDMVADFQTKSDIFVFLLSTRAGGVGINLTAADTVIFYDSDWNPTVDQQAMDRAHRVGQTKQVTVYRLICKATIEERILQRAKEKSEIQRMVISGGNFKPDTLKPKEVVSLLMEDDIEQQFRARQHERRALDEQRVEYNRVKMRKRYAEKKLERVQQECKRRRVEDESSPVDVCGSPAPSPARSDSSEERSTPAPMDSSSNGHLPVLSEDASQGGPSADLPDHSTDAADAASPAAPLIAAPSLANTTVRGHRKRGRPRMNGVRGRSAARTPHAASPGTASPGLPCGPGGVPVKRGRGRPRLLPLGPGHQGQRPIQQLPAALGALQLRGTDDTAPHGPP